MLSRKVKLLLVGVLALGVVLLWMRVLDIELFPARPGNCLVVAQKYCQQAEVVRRDDHFWGVGLRLPAKTVIFAPYAGPARLGGFYPKLDERVFSYTSLASDQDRYGENVWDVKQRLMVVGYFAPDLQTDRPLTAGEVMARSSGQTLEAFGGYQLLVRVQKPNAERYFVTDESASRELFGL